MNLSLKARTIERFLVITKFNKHSGLRKVSNSRKLLEIKYRVSFITRAIYNVKKSQIKDIDVYTINSNSKRNDTIFYLHGGSYIYNPTILHFRLLNKIAKLSGVKIVIPIYKKLPNYNFSDNHDILVSLYKQISKNNVILMGDSAGGGLCLSLFPELNKIKVPDKVILISPWVDFDLENECIDDYVSKDLILNVDSLKVLGKLWQGSNKDINPATLDVSNIKNLFLFIGDREIFFPDITSKFSGVKNNCLIDIAPNMQHNYLLFPIKEASNAIDKIVSIIGK